MAKNILTLVGIIVDVSGSMKSNINDGVFEKGSKWTRSIFRVINDLIKHDLPFANKMFCLGTGAKLKEHHAFDLISMLKRFPKISAQKLSFEETIEGIVQILENNGADAIRKWARMKTIKEAVADDLATMILLKLQSDQDFVKYFVDVCLPNACKGFKPEVFKRERKERTNFNELDTAESKGSDLSKTFKSEDSITHCSFKCLHYKCEIHECYCNCHVIDRWPSYFHDCCMCSRVSLGPHECKCLLHEDEIMKRKYCCQRHATCVCCCLEECEFCALYGFRYHSSFLERHCSLQPFHACHTCHTCHTCLLCYRYLKEPSKRKTAGKHPILEVGAAIGGWCIDKGESALSTLRPATKKDVITVVEKAKEFIEEEFTAQSLIYNVHQASKILNGSVEESLTEERIQELIEIVKPFIYGKTPMFNALENAASLFSDPKYHDHKKLLFVLSDGIPTDDGIKEQLFSKFKENDVTIVSCYITRTTHVEPRRLYSEPCREWEEVARFLFDLSTNIATQLLPRTIFVKRGWKIDIKNNETRLFMQVNHPDTMKDVCDFARDVVCCQDALADILASISLDLYINQSNTGFSAQRQDGGTCYANAIAAVFHLSMKRIIGREGGYPDFKEVRKQLIETFGKKGANTLRVLKCSCPHFRLQCKEVDINGAMRAITAKRPVVVSFRLTEKEWEEFIFFYDNNKTGILTQNEINIGKRDHDTKIEGHAVVLTSFNSECLRLMNSWGTEWGDMGFFKVQNADVIGMQFFDVFWTLNDLTESERDYYTKHGARVAAKLQECLIGLQRAKYECPRCYKKSFVSDFQGQLLRAKCPKCQEEFRSDSEGNILALNMYLTSLCR